MSRTVNSTTQRRGELPVAWRSRKRTLSFWLTRVKKPLLLLGLAVMLTACAKPKFPGCNDVSCRPVSNDHAMTIWWQPDMRNGPFDFTQASVNE